MFWICLICEQSIHLHLQGIWWAFFKSMVQLNSSTAYVDMGFSQTNMKTVTQIMAVDRDQNLLHSKKRVLNTRDFHLLPRIREYDLSWRTSGLDTAHVTAHRQVKWFSWLYHKQLYELGGQKVAVMGPKGQIDWRIGPRFLTWVPFQGFLLSSCEGCLVRSPLDSEQCGSRILIVDQNTYCGPR